MIYPKCGTSGFNQLNPSKSDIYEMNSTSWCRKWYIYIYRNTHEFHFTKHMNLHSCKRVHVQVTTYENHLSNWLLTSHVFTKWFTHSLLSIFHFSFLTVNYSILTLLSPFLVAQRSSKLLSPFRICWPNRTANKKLQASNHKLGFYAWWIMLCCSCFREENRNS